MSLDPLVTIILLIYLITVLVVLVIWFAITLGSRTSLSLTKIQQPAKSVETKARVKREIITSSLKQGQRKTKSNRNFNNYRHKRQQASLRERNFRVFSREATSPKHSRSKESLVTNKPSGQTKRKQDHNDSYARSIKDSKNLSAASKSSQKLNNDQFRGESAKKRRSYSSIDLNLDEDFFKDFAKNKK